MTRQQGTDFGLEPRDARLSFVTDQGALHGQTGADLGPPYKGQTASAAVDLSC